MRAWGVAVAKPGDYDAFLEYSHASLPNQLALQGMRGLELGGDVAHLQAALASGAQLISTDLPEVGMSARYDSDFVALLPDGGPARCNPVNAPQGCRDDRLER